MVQEDVDVIMEYEWIIHTIMKRFSSYTTSSKEDLYQVGILALLKAYQNFDPNYGVKFSSYAYPYVLGEISKYVKDDRSIHVSHDVIKLNASLERAKDILTQKLMRAPTLEELSLFLDIDQEKIVQIVQAKMSTLYVKSLDYTLNEEEDSMNLYHSIKKEESSYDPDILDLKDALVKLGEEERKLIYSRYYQDMTQSETSAILGMSQVQVSRKEAKILQKLKQDLVS